MKGLFVSIAISTALSLCLLIGPPAAAAFALYILIFFNALAWVGTFAGTVKGETARRIRKYSFLSGLSTGLQLYALITAGHSLLAASCFLVSFFIVVLAFKNTEEAPCKP